MYKGWDIIIDKEKMRYKKLYSFLGIPMGEGWKNLFEVRYVSLTKVNMIKTNRSGRTIGNESSNKVERFVVYLFGEEKNMRIEVCKKKAFNDAQSIAQQISKYLEVPLKDFINS